MKETSFDRSFISKKRALKCTLLILSLLIIAAGMVLFGAEESSAASRDVEWGRYQNSIDNNGVTDKETPASYEEAALKWGKQLVQGYTTSFTPPLLIDGYIYTASAQRVYKLDKETGNIVKESDRMEIDVSYAMHPMTYSPEEDSLYLPLLNGRVQCIDADTLELKWLSKSYNGTQALSPITYKDGYVYTGIWEKELSDGVYFCLNAKTGKTVWTLRPSELRTVTKASSLPEFAKPTGQEKPDNFYTYTALITVVPEDGYKFDRDNTGRYWLYDKKGNKVSKDGVKDSALVPATVNGRAAELEYLDAGTGEAVIHAKFDFHDGAFTQQGGEQESTTAITGIDIPAVGSVLDTDASVSDHLTIKKVEWKEGDIPHGFYWAGCYANDKYVVFGSDDGQNNTFGASGDTSYTETSTVYCCDRMTGEIVDRIDGCKGDIRSTIVHKDGYLYFTSKGGVLYKVKLGSDGKFSDLSSFDTGALMTASPVIYNGRIYVGVCGMAGQFNADGGHKFCVFRDDDKLTGEAIYEDRLVGSNTVKVMVDGTGSFQYCVDIAGYPQAAPVLSTYGAGSGGTVRLYFTFNAFPGGIYYLEDSPSSTKVSHKEAELLFSPETGMEQYCISPIAVDKDGTLYIKNDSGYMMAVARNKAYLNDIKVYAGDNEVEWEKDFRPGTLSYTLKAPNDAAKVDFVLDVPSGMTAAINGKAYKSGKVSVPVTEDMAATTVTVTKQDSLRTFTRTYTLNMKTASNNANLGGFAITDSNTAPKYIIDSGDLHTNTLGIGFDPVFDPATTKYVSREYGGRKEFLNIWVAKADSDQTIKVYPVDSVGNDLAYTDADGTIPDKGSSGKMRFPVYFIKGKISAEVRIEVTSASGKVSNSYNVELVRDKANIDVGKEPLYVTPATVTLYTSAGARTCQAKAMIGDKDVTDKCTWTSSRPSRVTVDASGMIAAQGLEVARDNPVSVWASYGAQDTEDRPVSVAVVNPPCADPEASIVEGRYTEEQSIVFTSGTPGAKIYYNIGDPTSEQGVAAPDDKSTLYTGPIRLGEQGKSRQYRIRAIAMADGYSMSAISGFDYVIDLREPVSEIEMTDPAEPAEGSAFDTDVKVSTGGIKVNKVEWLDVTDGTEKAAPDKAEAGKDYRVRITLEPETDAVRLSDETLARLGDVYGNVNAPGDGTITVTSDYISSKEISEINITGVKAPEGGASFQNDAVSATRGISVTGVTWKKAGGAAAPEKPEYDTEYQCEIEVSPLGGYSIKEGAKAKVNSGGTLSEGSIKASDGKYLITCTARSTKAKLAVGTGNGLAVSPDQISGLPNGTSVDEIRKRLAGCTVYAQLADGSRVALDSESTFWDEKVISQRYDETLLAPVPFMAEGTVTLPDYIDANGSDLKVRSTVSVMQGKVENPTFTPATAVYTKAQEVMMTSATPGASIFYTRGDKDGTFTYEGPTTVEGTYGKSEKIIFKAYAMCQGVKSETVKYEITIDRTGEKLADAKKYKVKSFKAKAKSRKFTLTWKKTTGATGYQLQYKLKKAKKWSNLKKLTKLKLTTKKLKKGQKYQFRIRTYTKVAGKTSYGKWATITAKCK